MPVCVFLKLQPINLLHLEGDETKQKHIFSRRTNVQCGLQSVLKNRVPGKNELTI